MSLMLASVTGPDEAEIAVRQGADIVDLKDVTNGFGAVSLEVLQATISAVAGRCQVSAVVGVLAADFEQVGGVALSFAKAGAHYVKIGLPLDDNRRDWIRAFAPLMHGPKIIGVMFADDGADNSLIQLLAQCGFAGVMLDTAHKTGKRLVEHMDIPTLSSFVEAARSYHLVTGLAGSIDTPDVPRLLLANPDVLGFRGALCLAQNREGGIDPDAVARIRSLIPGIARDTDSDHDCSKVDYSLLAARGYSIDTNPGEVATDRIFVRDFELLTSVGAYRHEKNLLQKVRFNIEAKVCRVDHAATEMSDVFSYDLITDAIRLIVAQGHIALLEAMAERIAALLLGHLRIASVTVRIEKLDIGPGAVGVEIVRARTETVAPVNQVHSYAGPLNPASGFFNLKVGA